MLWIIVLLMGVMFILSIKKNSARYYKNEIVSLGILGTFVGIAMGLYSFDALNIKDSMPALINGLKTAFVTSGIGISLSILISIIRPVQQNKTTLADISANQEKMIEVLESSLNNIARSANRDIISSLEQVVKQFNQNLTEQFGQNFKELNSAVKALVIWQSNYKEQIQLNEESVTQVLNSLTTVTKMQGQQEKNISNVIGNLARSSADITNNLSKSSIVITNNLKQSTQIVEENIQLLLREANGR
ncbi:hypothetical protein [Colwellia sp. 12G3]|uniref:hypothetical protein n=1 Tax=Colwellia sp. 12G3 TaxID=2058299 RepID=UPI000C32080B|nr:hypothetical protein [Colwellia sp. 12G3]PKI12714.1 hypothetical protein CXF71_18435 [Colwellia sp. 12G3]